MGGSPPHQQQQHQVEQPLETSKYMWSRAAQSSREGVVRAREGPGRVRADVRALALGSAWAFIHPAQLLARIFCSVVVSKERAARPLSPFYLINCWLQLCWAGPLRRPPFHTASERDRERERGYEPSLEGQRVFWED